VGSDARKPGISHRVLARVSQSGPDRFWTVADFYDLAAAPGSIDRALLRLSQADLLRRVRHGLYWRGQPTTFGMTLPDDLVIAARVADVGGVGPAGLSAANELGLTTQVPGLTFVAVPRRPPRDLPTVHFVDRAGRRARATYDLTSVEVAVLEVLGDWDQVVDVSAHAHDRLVDLVISGAVRTSKLAAASMTEPAQVRSRLKSLLSDAGDDGAASKVRSTSSLAVTA
jgi:hypothetical protein